MGNLQRWRKEQESMNLLGAGFFDSVYEHSGLSDKVVLYTEFYQKVQLYQELGWVYGIEQAYTRWHNVNERAYYRVTIPRLYQLGFYEYRSHVELQSEIKLIQTLIDKAQKRVYFTDKYKYADNKKRIEVSLVRRALKRELANLPIHAPAIRVLLLKSNRRFTFFFDDKEANYMKDSDGRIIPTDAFCIHNGWEKRE